MDLTKKERDCIIKINEYESAFPLRLIELAKRVGIKAPTAYQLVKRLSSKGLVSENRGVIIPTKKGRQAYKDIIMAHRCVETLLNRAGVPKNCACTEAQKIDYKLTPSYVKLLYKFIGSPKNCPHGKPVIVS